MECKEKLVEKSPLISNDFCPENFKDPFNVAKGIIINIVCYCFNAPNNYIVAACEKEHGIWNDSKDCCWYVFD